HHSKTFTDRSVLALAEAIMPGSARIPAADEETVRRAEEALSELGPMVVKGWRFSQAFLSAAAIVSTGRPFHALSVQAQDALIRKWERNPLMRKPLAMVSTAYKLVHFDLPPTYQALGGKLNVVKNIESPRWLQQIHRAAEWEEGDEIECEVVVIGTGAGG